MSLLWVRYEHNHTTYWNELSLPFLSGDSNFINQHIFKRDSKFLNSYINLRIMIIFPIIDRVIKSSLLLFIKVISFIYVLLIVKTFLLSSITNLILLLVDITSIIIFAYSSLLLALFNIFLFL